ncbi:NIPSNAP family protein [Rosistilla oblonga]|uniref:NIPSNAP family protein n=1 Tax=Rosistilla oblonga TaxID=2527990 RepID=UPI003A97D221
MIRTLVSLLIAGVMMTQSFAVEGKQYFEIRQYKLKENADPTLLDAYLSDALLPALNRMGIEPVGLFKTDSSEEQESRFVLIPLDNAGQVAEIPAKLAADKAYAEAATEYNQIPPSTPILDRVRSELLIAFDVLPRLNQPELSKNKEQRIFELRTYESATEHRGDLKVEMFNSGEVPIFLDCGIQPIFFGQAIVGDKIPNLTYMTVYPNQEAKDEGWKKFRVHPDWKVLSKKERYANTVSTIHKWNLLPLPASQL